MHILGPYDRRVHIHTTPDPAAAAPVVDLALRVVRERRDVLEDVGLAGRGGDVERGQVGAGQRLEDGVDEGRDVLGVLRVGVVDARGAGDEVGIEDDFARGLEAGGPVDVERDGVVVCVAVVAGGADGALHAGFGAVGVRDVGPEDGDFGGEGVGAGAGVEVQGGVGGDGVGVRVGVGLDGGAGEFDEGVWVVEEASADGGVVDPGGGREAAELVGGGEAGEDGGVPDAGFHEELGGFERAAADDDAAGRGELEVGDGAADVGDDAGGLAAGVDDAVDPGAALEVEV